VTCCNTDDGNDEFADTHSSSADEEEFSSPNTVNELNTENRHDGINDICYNPAVGKEIKQRTGLAGLQIYVIMKGFLIPACMKNV
jgi:hypothetical protein